MRLSSGATIVASLAILVVLAFTIGVLGALQVERLNRVSVRMYHHDLLAIDAVANLSVGLRKIDHHLARLATPQRPLDRASLAAGIQITLEQNQALLARMQTMPAPLAERTHLAAFQRDYGELLPLIREGLRLGREGKQAEVLAISRSPRYLSALHDTSSELASLLLIDEGQASQRLEEERAIFVASRNGILALLGIIAAIVAALGLVLIRQVAMAVQALREVEAHAGHGVYAKETAALRDIIGRLLG